MNMSNIVELVRVITKFLTEFESTKRELRDVTDIVASQDKRIEQLEMLVHNG